MFRGRLHGYIPYIHMCSNTGEGHTHLDAKKSSLQDWRSCASAAANVLKTGGEMATIGAAEKPDTCVRRG